MNRKGQQIFQQLEMLNLITEEKSCREAGCWTWFRKNAGSHVKVSRNFAVYNNKKLRIQKYMDNTYDPEKSIC